MTSPVILEGLHALKHATRFNARVTAIMTDDLDKALAATENIDPTLGEMLRRSAQVVSRQEFRERVSQPVPTHVLAYAERPQWTLEQGLPTASRPTILLDDPRNSGNIGAVIRVGAACDAAGVLIRGSDDPFNPMTTRGAAGLQWAIPVWGSQTLLEQLPRSASRNIGSDGLAGAVDSVAPAGPASVTPVPAPSTTAAPAPLLVGLDADGELFDPSQFLGPTIFAFGSERVGLSAAVRDRCDRVVALPMRPHVSSLNLATCVAATLYLRQYAARALAQSADARLSTPTEKD
ncbi:MAG: TrmH family RNA methyltransferase [Propionibacteriaceae bacterium]|jgi:TrmH family RNA methyltransferase|nr:TrmH family RNA methyltransferase [Propionibacteriaceae bacterium]